MSTRRQIKGKVVPKWHHMARMFASVENYLNWVSESVVQINKDESQKRAKEKELLIKLVAIMLKRARRYSANFDRFIRVDGSKIKEIKKSVKKNLRRRVKNEYVYRLQVKRPRPGVFEVGDQMLAGYPHDVQPGFALMKLHKQLTNEERGQLRRQVRAILDPDNDCISPERMGKWIAPALKEALLDINDSVIAKHAVQVMLVHSKEGFFIIFSCLPETTDKNKVVTLKLEVQLSVDVEDLPAYFKIPHPFPNSNQHKKRAQAMIKELKQGFEVGEHSIKLYCSLAKVVSLPKIKSPIYKSRSQRILERAQTEVYGKKEEKTDPRAWRIDFEVLEKVIYKKIKTDARFMTVQEAFALYQTLSLCGNKVLPPINQRTRSALSLWLFKQTSDNSLTRYETFKFLLMMVDGCLDNKFCPAFVQPKLNTLDADAGDSRRVMFESSEEDDAAGAWQGFTDGEGGEGGDSPEGQEEEDLDEAQAMRKEAAQEEPDSEDEAQYKNDRRDLTKDANATESNNKANKKPQANSNKKSTKTAQNSKAKTGKNEPKEPDLENDQLKNYYKRTKAKIDQARARHGNAMVGTLALGKEPKDDKNRKEKTDTKQGDTKSKSKKETAGAGSDKADAAKANEKPHDGTRLQIENDPANDEVFKNKKDDDEEHERLINNEPSDTKNAESEQNNAEVPIEEETSEQQSVTESQSSKLDLSRTLRTRIGARDSSRERDRERSRDRKHQSIFKLIRENTEFETYRELEKQERRERGETLSSKTSAGTRTTDASTSTQQTETSEAENTSGSGQNKKAKREKISDIAKLIRIMEANNVAAAIKYIDVYAIKLLMKFEEEEGQLGEENNGQAIKA